MEGKVIAIIMAVVLFVVGILFVVDIFNPQYGFFAKVEAGHIGICDRFGQVKEAALQPGFHVTGYFEKVVPIDARVQKQTTDLEAFSADIQQVQVRMTVNFKIVPERAGILYKSIGMNYVNSLIFPRLMEDTKTVIGGYTAETIITNRAEISEKVLAKMRTDMEQYGIDVTVISIEDIGFTDAFESAVEEKQVATQKKQKAQTEQEQATMEARQEAERRKIAANADAEVAKIEADAAAYRTKVKAEAEADANKMVAESITEDLIQYVQANGWDGKLPGVYMSSDGALPIINTNDYDPFAEAIEAPEDSEDPYQN